jgi:hypothetical protein
MVLPEASSEYYSPSPPSPPPGFVPGGPLLGAALLNMTDCVLLTDREVRPGGRSPTCGGAQRHPGP